MMKIFGKVKTMIISWLQLLGLAAGEPVFTTPTAPGDNLCLNIIFDDLGLNVITDLIIIDLKTDAFSGNLIDGRLVVC